MTKKTPKKTSRDKKLKVLFVATEAAPFVKAGGLGDVMYSLPVALKEKGHDIRVMIPRYGTIEPEEHKLSNEIKGLRVPTGQKEGPHKYLVCNVKKYSNKKTVTTYFLENMEYYEKRANVYGYSDDHIRWALFSKGVIEFLKKSSWKPDLIVASDWQAGLIPDYLKTIYKEDDISSIPVVFCIHNLSYQGMCDFRFIKESEKDSGQEAIPGFFNSRLAKLNWMLRGIMYADTVVTVSPTYAKEILTPEYGEGLEKILAEKQHHLYGILNGINYEHYSPQDSPHIPEHYSVKNIEIKKKNKKELQKRFGLPKRPDVFVAGMVSRLAPQKGFDLLEKMIHPLLGNLDTQIVFLGDGEGRYKKIIEKAREEYPQKVGYIFEFNLELPHLVFAGSDVTFLPSKFEPCGVVQMQAMKYGALPIARKTGGLADTVKSFDLKKKEGNGILFEDYDPWSFYTAIIKAATTFQFKDTWKKLIKNAMKEDFSWDKSAKKYEKVFKKTLEK